jgi:hypothetical protein
MRFRRFNETGVNAFEEYLGALRVDPHAAVPVDLLERMSLTESLREPIEAEIPAAFASRMEFARWLHAAAEASGARVSRDDTGFWAWLSLALFDHVCPADGQGRRKPGANARHIIDGKDWKRRYRHLLQNPYEIFYLHRDEPDRALVVLINPLHMPGELTEQINGRQEIVKCPGCMSLATFLCIDQDGSRRRGASGEFARVFGKMVNRVSRTWDIPMMQPVQSAVLLQKKKLQKLVEAAMSGTTAE